MVNELRTMLHDTVRVPPADGTDARHILAAARGRVRRRRVTVALGAAALTVTVGATPALVGALGGLTGTTGIPASGTPPVGPVLQVADAEPAVEGRDYDVLATLVNENLERANGQYANGVTEDGHVVVQDGPHGAENRIRWGLLDPRTETTQWLPETPAGAAPPEHLIEATGGRLVFLAEVTKPGVLVAWTYERSSNAWEQRLLDVARTGMSWENSFLAGSRIGPEDRLYLAVTIGDRLVQSRLWSVPLEGEGDPADLREEGVVGDWDIEGDELTFTESTNRPSSIIHVRDLATGEERSFDAQSGSRCNALGLDQVGERIVLSQFCGETPEGRDDRVQIVTTHGDPVVTLQDDGLDFAGATDEFVTVRSYAEDASGAYVYEFDTGRFLRLGEGHVRYAGSHVGRGDVLTWTTPVNGGDGMKIWVARFD
jgi:hypothetical protein